MATTGRVDVLGTVPTIVAKEMLKYTMPNLELWKRINTKITAGFNVGDTQQIPAYNEANATPNAGSSAAVQLQTGTAAGFSGGAELDPLVATYVDQTSISVANAPKVYVANWFYVAMELSTYAEAVAQGDLVGTFRQAGLDSLAVQIDTSVATLVTSFTSNAALGTLGTALTDDLILDGMGNLDGQNVPGDGRSYVFSNLEKANYMKLDKYTNSLYRGDVKPVTRGDIGNLYGMGWAWTTQVLLPAASQHRNMMFHRDAIAGVLRRDPEAHVVDMPDPGMGRRIISTAIWGVNLIRNRFGQQMLGV